MSSESKQDFGVPFFAGVNSPRLFAGVERTALGWVIAPAAGFGMLAFQMPLLSSRQFAAAALAALVLIGGLWGLRRVARHDPIFWRVSRRNRRYRRFYPARSTPYRSR